MLINKNNMKKLLLIQIFIFAIIGCKKEETTTPVQAKTSTPSKFIGYWIQDSSRQCPTCSTAITDSSFAYDWMVMAQDIVIMYEKSNILGNSEMEDKYTYTNDSIFMIENRYKYALQNKILTLSFKGGSNTYNTTFWYHKN